MEPETKLEAMTYLVSFMHYSLTHSLTHYLRLPLSPLFNIHPHLYQLFLEK